jgi:hypothetical protein
VYRYAVAVHEPDAGGPRWQTARPQVLSPDEDEMFLFASAEAAAGFCRFWHRRLGCPGSGARVELVAFAITEGTALPYLGGPTGVTA